MITKHSNECQRSTKQTLMTTHISHIMLQNAEYPKQTFWL